MPGRLDQGGYLLQRPRAAAAQALSQVTIRNRQREGDHVGAELGSRPDVVGTRATPDRSACGRSELGRRTHQLGEFIAVGALADGMAQLDLLHSDAS